MTLEKSGNWWRAATAADLDEYLLKHVLERHCNGVAHRVTHAVCSGCGSTIFDLFKDDGDRIERVCTMCQSGHKICNLDGKFDVDSADEIVCDCMYSECEVAVGFALMESPTGGTDGFVAHLYVAGRCTECGNCGVYGEWGPDGDYLFPELAKNV